MTTDTWITRGSCRNRAVRQMTRALTIVVVTHNLGHDGCHTPRCLSTTGTWSDTVVPSRCSKFLVRPTRNDA